MEVNEDNDDGVVVVVVVVVSDTNVTTTTTASLWRSVLDDDNDLNFNYVHRRERRDVDDGVVNDKNVGSRRHVLKVTTCFRRHARKVRMF